MFERYAPAIIGGTILILGLLSLLVLVGIGISETIWLPRNKWVARSSYTELEPKNDPNNAIDQRKYWRSPQPQAEGDEYSVNFWKPSRVLN